jgi:hypothetical protein
VLYLSGSWTPALPSEVGFMRTPMIGNLLPSDRIWAADTGCFLQPDKHDDDKYISWLEKNAHAADRCLFATAPDVVGDAVATLARSLPMLGRIRAAGYRAALVAQDGIENTAIPWDEFDALFVGGTTEWKLSERSFELMAEAKRRGKWVHVGRVNSLKRLRRMEHAGADSADGTFVAFGPDVTIPRLKAWLDTMSRQPSLFTSGVEKR